MTNTLNLHRNVRFIDWLGCGREMRECIDKLLSHFVMVTVYTVSRQGESIVEMISEPKLLRDTSNFVRRHAYASSRVVTILFQV